jgi:hypothetical protein
MDDFTRFELADRETAMARENELLAVATQNSALRERCWEFARQHWRKARLLLSDNAAREITLLLGGSIASLALHPGEKFISAATGTSA